MSRHSDYAGIDADTPAAALRERGIDPATWSLACLVGRHDDCQAVLDSPRDRGHAAAPCACDTPGCTHHARPARAPRRSTMPVQRAT